MPRKNIWLTAFYLSIESNTARLAVMDIWPHPHLFYVSDKHFFKYSLQLTVFVAHKLFAVFNFTCWKTELYVTIRFAEAPHPTSAQCWGERCLIVHKFTTETRCHNDCTYQYVQKTKLERVCETIDISRTCSDYTILSQIPMCDVAFYTEYYKCINLNNPYIWSGYSVPSLIFERATSDPSKTWRLCRIRNAQPATVNFLFALPPPPLPSDLPLPPLQTTQSSGRNRQVQHENRFKKKACKI